MLCCRCLQNNLHIACISIGLIELTLCMLRFGILSTRIECICQPARYQFLCTPIMRFSREFIFLFEVASSVVIIVGTDKVSGGLHQNMIPFVFYVYNSIEESPLYAVLHWRLFNHSTGILAHSYQTVSTAGFCCILHIGRGIG